MCQRIPTNFTLEENSLGLCITLQYLSHYVGTPVVNVKSKGLGLTYSIILNEQLQNTTITYSKFPPVEKTLTNRVFIFSDSQPEGEIYDFYLLQVEKEIFIEDFKFVSPYLQNIIDLFQKYMCNYFLTGLHLNEVQEIINFNENKFPLPNDLKLIELIEKQFSVSFDKIAIIDHETNVFITYKELEHTTAKKLRFIDYTLKNTTLKSRNIMVYMDKSHSLVSTIIAILKINALYLPVDISTPKSRLEYIVKDSSPVCIIVDSEEKRNFIIGIDNSIPCVNLNDNQFNETAEENLDLKVNNISYDILNKFDHCDSLYLMYTSGSTGNPKAVIGSEIATLNRLFWMERRFEICEDEILLLKTSIGFVDSVWEILAPLLRGVTLITTSNELCQDPMRISELILERKVTRLVAVPSLLSSLMTIENIGRKLNSLKYIVSSGEPLGIELYSELKKIFFARIINLYGSTEVAGDVTFFDGDEVVERADFFSSARNIVPLGYPIDNTNVYIMNKNLQVLPRGFVGEIFIMGKNLSLGYHNNEEETQVSFPILQECRLYNTKDLGFIDFDGCLHYVGRSDNQIKIRGNRVELGELENAIHQLPYVKAAVVSTFVDDRSYSQVKLIAFFVPKNKNIFSQNNIIVDLSLSLPTYMLPSATLLVDSFPHTVSGKVDKIALLNMYQNSLDIKSTDFVAPITAIEIEIQQIWMNVLGKKEVSIVDNFINIGGDSLLAFSITNMIQSKYNCKLNIIDLFQNPTIMQLSKLVEQQGLRGEENKVIKKQDKYPLVFLQRSFWFQHQIYSNSITTNIPITLWVDGILDVNILLLSLQSIVERHEIFRIQLSPGENGIPSQTFVEFSRFQFKEYCQTICKCEEWKKFFPAQRKVLTFDLVNQLFQIPFNLNKNEFFKFFIIRASNDQYGLLLNLSHFISDGWSSSLLTKELTYFYSVHIGLNVPNLANITYSFSDYIADHFEHQKISTPSLNFWLTKFKDIDTIAHPEFIPDFPHEKFQLMTEYQADREYLTFDTDFMEKLKTYSSQNEATLFVTILASFNVLIYRYSGASDILIGTPYAIRSTERISQLIGPFVNMIPIRTKISEISFNDFLLQCKQNLFESCSHSDIPFEIILENVSTTRDANENFFQTVFVQEEEDYEFNIDLFKSEKIPIDRTSLLGKYTIFLRTTRDSSVSLCFEYPKYLYKKTSITRILNNWKNLLIDIVESGGVKRLGKLNLLDAQQRLLLKEHWNMDAKIPEDIRSIYQLFLNTVHKYPNNKAVKFGEFVVTYQELYVEVEKLAATMVNRGIHCGSVIGINLPKSINFVIAILSIIRIGCCYVYIDNSYPTARLERLILESQMKYILTDENGLSFSSVLIDKSSIIICSDKENILFHSSTPKSDINETCLLLYTSGTSGNPKGYRISHKNLISLFSGSNFQSIKPQDVVGCISNLNFDLSMFEIYSSLLSGSLLVLISLEKVLDPEELIKELHNNKVNHLSITTSLFHVLGMNSPTCFHNCTLYIGGEKINGSICEKVLMCQLPPKEIINIYGPGEITYACNYYSIQEIPKDKIIPLGRPMTNSSVYVLNSELELQPFFGLGEICVSGSKVSAGYLDRGLNGKFKYLPGFRSEEHNRIYCTGDMGYIRDDGVLIFVGRKDFQTKIRGHRVDLEEIQSVIESHPKVDQAKVLSSEITEKFLVAFIKGTCSKDEIRTYLEQIFHKQSIPAFFEFLPEFPLTDRGKIDNRKLIFDFNANVLNLELDQTLNTNEIAVHKLFTSVLGINSIPIKENFFAVGGNSILAMSLLLQLNTQFGVSISLKQLFKNPSISGIASLLSNQNNYQPGDQLPFNMDLDTSQYCEFPLSHSQKRIWLMWSLYPQLPIYNIPIILKFDKLNVDALKAAILSLYEDFPTLRVRFHFTDNDVVQIVENPQLPFKFVEMEQENMDQFIIDEQLIPFNLQKSPMIRFLLVSIKGTNYFVLVITVHHIVADRISNNILLRELSVRYNSYCSNSIVHKPRYQFFQYIIAEINYYAQNRDYVEKAIQYWDQHLSNLPTVNLPLKVANTSIDSDNFRANTLHSQIPNILVESIRAFILNQQSSLNIFFLSVIHLLKYRYTKKNDFSINTVISNRMCRESEDIIGFFVNNVIVRSEIRDDNISFKEFFIKYSENALESFVHSKIDYHIIADHFNKKERSNPLNKSDIIVTYYHYEKDHIWKETGGNELDYDLPISRFPIEFTFMEQYNGDIAISLVYNNSYETSQMKRFLGHYNQLLYSVMRNLDARISSFHFVPLAEVYELTTFSITRKPVESISKILSEIERDTPTKIALQSSSVSVTYSELEEKKLNFAYSLMRLGIEPYSTVGIAMPNGIDCVIAILGINRAGCSFIPIDMSLPTERLQKMIELIELNHIVTTPKYNEILTRINSDLSIYNYLDIIEINEKVVVPQMKLQSCYYLFTSGSTGFPKAISISEDALISRFYRFYPPSCVVGQIGSQYFDPFIAEIYGTLLSGGTLVFPDKDFLYSLDDIESFLIRNSITHISTTTNNLKLISISNPKALRSLEYVAFGGEQMMAKILKKLIFNPKCSLHNLYGPTETTFSCTDHAIDPTKLSEITDPIPIGSPQPNSLIYIVDDEFNILPKGIRGQIVIGGPIVGEGYVGNSHLTEKKFILDQVTDDRIYPSGVRNKLFLSGDIGVYTEQGKIQYISRSDSQVKFRGYRVECEEIQNLALTNSSIDDALVLVRKSEDNESLILYYSGSISEKSIRNYLQLKLPNYMFPTQYVKLQSLPKFSSNGKIDREKLLQSPIVSIKSEKKDINPKLPLQLVQQAWNTVLGYTPQPHLRFFECGGTSLSLVSLQFELKKLFKFPITLPELLEYTTIARQTEYFGSSNDNIPKNIKSKILEDNLERDIAIVGLDCIFPKAKNLSQFWSNLYEGVDCISDFDSGDSIRKSNHFVQSSGVVDECEYFDFHFFQMKEAEARIIDPQHRLILESCHNALESASIDPIKYEQSDSSRIGVFFSLAENTYYKYCNLDSTDLDSAYAFQLQVSNLLDSAPTRVAYKLGTTGPAMAVQTACSSSMVAIHTACQSIIVGDCSAAIAGGVSISFPQDEGYFYQEGMILSYDGRCKPFDINADGIVGGNGVGTVVLMKLSEAISNGYKIYGVIKGSSVNNDGNTKASYSSSSIPKHIEVINSALKRARLESQAIQFIETHGAGTVIGDLIEVSAYSKVYNNFIPLGSVKSNIGHLGPAAGVASLIKVILSMENNAIPPTLHFTEFHPQIMNLDHRFYVNTKPKSWKSKRKIAAVHSFGQGGTNSHLIVTNYIPDQPSQIKIEPPYIINLSGVTATTVNNIAKNLTIFISKNISTPLESVSKTLCLGRKDLLFRKSLVVSNSEELLKGLQTITPDNIQQIQEIQPSSIFLFPGQGSQFLEMGKWYLHFDSFKDTMELCNKLLKKYHKIDILDQLCYNADPALLQNTLFSQVSTFVISYSVYNMLTKFNIFPSIVMGHSSGEYAAACVAGVFSLKDALHLIVKRSMLLEKIPDGAMLAVRAGINEGQSLQDKFSVNIAAINQKNQIVFSGEDANIENLRKYCKSISLKCTKLGVNKAYHSKSLDYILPEYEEVVKNVSLFPPKIQMVSSYTGKCISNEITSPSYWCSQMRNTVLYDSAFEFITNVLMKKFYGRVSIIEVGPGQSLYNLANSKPKLSESVYLWNPLLSKSQSSYFNLVDSLAHCWEMGSEVNFSSLFPKVLPFATLPTCPYEKVLCTVKQSPLINNIAQPSLQQSIKIGDSSEKNKKLKVDTDRNAEIELLNKLVISLSDSISHLTKTNLALTNLLASQSPMQFIESPHLTDNLNSEDQKILANYAYSLISSIYHSKLVSSIGFFNCQYSKQILHVNSESKLIHNSNLEKSIFPIGCLSSLYCLYILDCMIKENFISLHDNLKDIIPSFLCKIPSYQDVYGKTHDLQILHLASHTSGLASIPADMDISGNSPNSVHYYTISQLLNFISTSKLLFQPGSNCSYSIIGTSLLCHCLAFISSKSFTNTTEEYQKLISKYITSPLNMQTTGLYPNVESSPISSLARFIRQGYSSNGSISTWLCGTGLCAADGVYSSVKDMLVFCDHLISTKPNTVFRFMLSSKDKFWFIGLTNSSSCWIGLAPEKNNYVFISLNTEMEISYELTKLGEKLLNFVEGIPISQNFTSSFCTSEMFQLWNGLPTSPYLMNNPNLKKQNQKVEKEIIISNNIESYQETNASVSKDNPDLSKNNASTELVRFNVATLLGTNSEAIQSIPTDTPFQKLGLDSLQLISLTGSLSKSLTHSIPINAVYEHPTIQSLAKYLNSNFHYKTEVRVTSLPPSLNSYSFNSPLPLVIEPSKRNKNNFSSLSYLNSILQENNSYWNQLLTNFGAILFRGFAVHNASDFLKVVQSFSTRKNNDYKDGISPRTPVIGESVFTSTEYPSQYNMALHNEMSYTANPPKILFFFCQTPPDPHCGGETPIADSAKILSDLIATRKDIAQTFKEKGLKYIINLPSKHRARVGLSWQQTYKTDDPAVVSEFCKQNNINFQWIGEDGSTANENLTYATLRTDRSFPATRTHPTLPTEVWFNHSHLFHPSDLPYDTKEALELITTEDNFPKNCTFKDGSEIPLAYLEHIRHVLKENELTFSWKKGDILIIDNYLVAHGRRAFTGDKRKILVSMV